MSSHNKPFLVIKKKIIINYPKSATMGFVLRDSRRSSKQPSVFEPLKFYCMSKRVSKIHWHALTLGKYFCNALFS